MCRLTAQGLGEIARGREARAHWPRASVRRRLGSRNGAKLPETAQRYFRRARARRRERALAQPREGTSLIGRDGLSSRLASEKLGAGESPIAALPGRLLFRPAHLVHRFHHTASRGSD